ncbi:MAG TPA: outer membrane lipoprotein-sorting protein [Vicinamibacterales bacterium]|nr:outer membrane lipoprotein-sorting protein [Vicinamibacterales bacterium]
MHALALVAVVVALSSIAVHQKPEAVAETADWLARQIDQRDTGRDSRLDMVMRVFDRHGRVRQRALTVTGLKETGTRGDRVLVRFTAPNDIKGTGLLVWEHPAAEDERFLYLPALGRVRRIAGTEKQESFVGSDLSYEDIGGRDLADYSYALAQRDATWTGPDGRAYPAWHLESTVIDKSATHPRTVSVVRKDNFMIVSAEVFNRRNERDKRLDVRRIERIEGIWTAMDVVMVNDAQKTRTELAVISARYNTGLSEADFSRRALEQGDK